MAAPTIAELDAKIKELTDSPRVDYQIGDKKVSASQYLTQLLAIRKHLLENPQPDLATMHFDVRIDAFGRKLGEEER